MRMVMTRPLRCMSTVQLGRTSDVYLYPILSPGIGEPPTEKEVPKGNSQLTYRGAPVGLRQPAGSPRLDPFQAAVAVTMSSASGAIAPMICSTSSAGTPAAANATLRCSATSWKCVMAMPRPRCASRMDRPEYIALPLCNFDI